MVVNVFIVIAPNGDRPYVSSHLPETLVQGEGVRVFKAVVDLPDSRGVEVGTVKEVQEVKS